MPREQEAEIKYVTYIVKHKKICLACYWRGEKMLSVAAATGECREAGLDCLQWSAGTPVSHPGKNCQGMSWLSIRERGHT